MDINHGPRAAILKKNSWWLLPFYMSVVTYFYYEKVRRRMRAATVSHLLKSLHNLSFFFSNTLIQFRIIHLLRTYAYQELKNVHFFKNVE